MAFELPKLPFAKDALAPFLSAETFDYHHGKHHAAYVNNLNKLIDGTEFAKMSLEDGIRATYDWFKRAHAERCLRGYRQE